MDFARSLGLHEPGFDFAEERRKLQLYINLKLASSGQPTAASGAAADFMATAHDLLQSYREKNRMLSSHLCPCDRRIQDFLDRYLGDLELDEIPALPHQTFILDRHGVARELSLPLDGDVFRSDIRL